MAAHDDQISKNRRRLFKALSAAPVVMTLRPGSALAQGSAFQCLENDPPATQFISSTEEMLCDVTDNCSAYADLFFWEIPDVPPQAACALQGGETLVQTDPDTYVTFPDGVEVDVNVVASQGQPGLWDIFPESSSAIPCYEGVSQQRGNFRVVAPLTLDQQGYDLTSVQPDFIQPQNPDAVGITQTCLMSVDPDATIAPNRFVKG